MSLVKAMDAGPVYGQSEAPLTGSETKQELADHLLNIGGAMVVELLPGILEGAIVALPQDDSLATYDNLIAKDDGTVDWQKPAEQLEREVRAYTGWPRSRTTLAGKEVVITAAKVVDQSGKPGEVTMYDKNILVYTGNEALLIQKLIPAGKKEMTAQAFLAGNKI
jgi:methionyl-tRNA formyltransferase